MKIKQIIKKLERILEKEGNLELHVDPCMGGEVPETVMVSQRFGEKCAMME